MWSTTRVHQIASSHVHNKAIYVLELNTELQHQTKSKKSADMLSSIRNFFSSSNSSATESKTSTPSSSVSSNKNTGTDRTYHVNDLLIPFPQDQIQLDPNYKEQGLIRCEAVDGVEGCWIIHNVLTLGECEQFINLSEGMGYKPSPLSVLSGEFNTSQFNESTRQIRDSHRILTDMPPELIRILNERIEELLPQTVTVYGDEWVLRKGTPINERIRFNRYNVTQKFGPHFDAGYKKNVNEMTQLTIVFYLNEDFKGGETTFFPGNKRTQFEEPGKVKEVRIVPKIGLVSVFFQNGELNHRHEGSPVTEGVKYIIRSDIAYVRAIPKPLTDL